jgi:hypothetical protein
MIERQVRLPVIRNKDRRIGTRYRLALDLRYSVLRRRQLLQAGSGRITDMSSSGLRFVADRPLNAGMPVELSIRWPVLLEGGVELQLKASGTIVWSRGTETALEFHSHEFRTWRRGLELQLESAAQVI